MRLGHFKRVLSLLTHVVLFSYPSAFQSTNYCRPMVAHVNAKRGRFAFYCCSEIPSCRAWQ